MTCFLLFFFSVGWFLIEGTEVGGIFEGTGYGEREMAIPSFWEGLGVDSPPIQGEG